MPTTEQWAETAHALAYYAYNCSTAVDEVLPRDERRLRTIGRLLHDGIPGRRRITRERLAALVDDVFRQIDAK